MNANRAYTPYAAASLRRPSGFALRGSIHKLLQGALTSSKRAVEIWWTRHNVKHLDDRMIKDVCLHRVLSPSGATRIVRL